MSFLEYLNRQLNPFQDADVQHAMNYGLAPGFPRQPKTLPWEPLQDGGISIKGGTFEPGDLGGSGQAHHSTAAVARQTMKPKQSRTASSSGRMSQPKVPTRNIPTLPNKPKPVIQAPVARPKPIMPQVASAPVVPPGMPAFGDEAPGMVAFEDAGFAPPMVPQFDYSQGMPFGQQTGLPMEYAPLPMPEVQQEQAMQPQQSPLLSLGLGRNVSPWGELQTQKNVEGIAARDKQFAHGKTAMTPEWESRESRKLGFIGPGGDIMPALNTPMQPPTTLNVARGIRGSAGEEEDDSPMARLRRGANAEHDVLSQQEAMLEAQDKQMQKQWKMAAMFGNKMAANMLMQWQARKMQMQSQLNRAHNDIDARVMQGAGLYDENTVPNRTRLRNAETNEFRSLLEAERANAQLTHQMGQFELNRAGKDETARHNRAQETEAQNDNMRSLSDNAARDMERAMTARANRESRESIARQHESGANARSNAKIKAAESMFGQKRNAKNEDAANTGRLKRLRQIESEVAKAKKGDITKRQSDIEAEFSNEEKHAVLKALKQQNPAATRQDYLHRLLEAGRQQQYDLLDEDEDSDEE